MKVKYIGESNPLTFINGKIYEVLSIECGMYRVIDETDEDYLYLPSNFEVVEDGDVPIATEPTRTYEESMREYLKTHKVIPDT